jgi:hypothetical protein
MALRVDGDQGLLHEILCLGCAADQASEPALEVAAQPAAQLLEQPLVRDRITVEARDHQRLELGLAGQHARLAFSVRCRKAFGYKAIEEPVRQLVTTV